jgi:hypothetical protein
VAPPLPDVDEEGAVLASSRVFLVLFFKEIYPLTYYTFWLLALAVSLVTGVLILIVAFVLLGPLLWAFEKILGGDEQRRGHNIASLKALGRAITKDPLKVFLHRSLAQEVQVCQDLPPPPALSTLAALLSPVRPSLRFTSCFSSCARACVCESACVG